MYLLSHFLRLFFDLLYHPLAWTYDLVAWMVSIGRWKDWVKCVTPFIEGTRVLELGHGPGHLQLILLGRDLLTVGLDESRQMGNLTKRRLSRCGYTKFGIFRGLGQNLPFPPETFDTIVATFPTEYIFEKPTTSEVWRTLKNGGRFILLPVAWVTGTGILDRFAAWLFRVTGQAPSDLSKESISRLTKPFSKTGFQVESKLLEVKSSRVLIIISIKTERVKL